MLFLFADLLFLSIFGRNNAAISANIVVFHDGDVQLDIPLRYIIYRNNYESDRVKFNRTLKFIPNSNTFKARNSLCDIVSDNDNVVAVFGGNLEISPILQSTCNQLTIPYIQTHWLPTNSYLDTMISLNFYPDSELLALGLKQLVDSLSWESFLILYQNRGGLVRLKQIIRHKNVMIERIQDDLPITLKTAINYKITNIIIDGDVEILVEVFKKAAELDMVSADYNYFLTNLDSHTLKLPDYECNITTVSIFDPYEQTFRDLVKFWERNERRNRLTIDPILIKTETVLMHDAMSLLIESVNSLKENVLFNRLTCDDNRFETGPDIVANMKDNFMNFPITGQSEFDPLGKRTNFTLFLFNNRNKMIASWNSKDTQNGVILKSDTEELMRNLQRSTLIVVTSLQRPYVMLKPNHEDLIGNQRFEGYCVDLIKKVAKIANFTYQIHLVGINRQIIDTVSAKHADLGIGDLTVTPEREEIVDFSLPFMRLGITVIYRKLDVEDSTWKFLDPITKDVWMYMGTLTIVLAIVLYFVSRMAPGDWENPHPCDQSPRVLKNIWNIKNCLWLTSGSIMNQGCDILPKYFEFPVFNAINWDNFRGISSRLVTSMWWFFALIVTQSYIASLAAFLTNKKSLVIKEVDDLGRQNKIVYGTVENSATYNFFQSSNNTIYQKMFESMTTTVGVLQQDVRTGFQDVLDTVDGSYAFLTESTTIEYEVERNCKFRMVKNPILRRTFGIAMPRNYPYRSLINDAILHLEEDGELMKMKDYWWKQRKENRPCTEQEPGPELTIEQLRGVFLILACGCIGALILGFLEFLYSVYNVSVENHISYMEALKIEGLFALKIWISQKRNKQLNNKNSGSKTSIINNKSTNSLDSNNKWGNFPDNKPELLTDL